MGSHSDLGQGRRLASGIVLERAGQGTGYYLRDVGINMTEAQTVGDKDFFKMEF